MIDKGDRILLDGNKLFIASSEFQLIGQLVKPTNWEFEDCGTYTISKAGNSFDVTNATKSTIFNVKIGEDFQLVNTEIQVESVDGDKTTIQLSEIVKVLDSNLSQKIETNKFINNYYGKN